MNNKKEKLGNEEERNDILVISILLAVFIPFLIVLFISNCNFGAIILCFVIVWLFFSILTAIINLIKKLK